MVKGCLRALILYGVIVSAYSYWGSPYWDPPATWMVPVFGGGITFLAIGALWNAWERWREWSLVHHARSGMLRRDGARAAVLGTIEAVGEPLLTPFSHTPAVMYEYEIRQRETQNEKGETIPVATGLGGVRMEPYRVRDGARSTLVLGMPDFTVEPEHRCTNLLSYIRAREFVRNTTYEDMSGANALRLFSTAIDIMADDDGSIEKHWQRDPQAEAWLHNDELNGMIGQYPDGHLPVEELLDEDEEEDEEDDLDEGTYEEELARERPHGVYNAPVLVEKYVKPGEEVCLFGLYSQEKGGLVPSLKQHTIALRMVRGKPDEIERKLRSSLVSNLVGGLVALVVVHLAIWGATMLYLRSPETQRMREDQLKAAIREGDLTEVEMLLAEGQPYQRYNLQNSLLGLRDEPEMIALLLKYGADPNATDQYGLTPLMEAARYGYPEVVRLLLEAGADIEFRSSMSNRTALMMAIDSEQPETAELLRAAGAHDDTVGAHNGEPVVGEAAPQIVVCVQYIEAIHAADPQRLQALSSRERPGDFEDIDWGVWHATRPAGEVDVSGYANDTAATISVQGPTPGGFSVTWVFQLVKEDGAWKILREDDRLK